MCGVQRAALKPLVAMVTELWSHALSVMVGNAYYASKIIMLHSNANCQTINF